jgi:hypothetical protein
VSETPKNDVFQRSTSDSAFSGPSPDTRSRAGIARKLLRASSAGKGKQDRPLSGPADILRDMPEDVAAILLRDLKRALTHPHETRVQEPSSNKHPINPSPSKPAPQKPASAQLPTKPPSTDIRGAGDPALTPTALARVLAHEHPAIAAVAVDSYSTEYAVKILEAMPSQAAQRIALRCGQAQAGLSASGLRIRQMLETKAIDQDASS